MHAATLHTLYSREVIASRVGELAREISRDYQGTVPLLIGVLKGSFVFMADLMRELTIASQIDFMRLASYGDSMASGGEILVTKDLEMSPVDRDLLVVEDIVDSGRTLNYLLTELRGRGPRSVKCCALVDKRQRREVRLTLDYVGFVMDQGFVVGYGLDWAEAFRYLPDICVVETDGVPPT